MGLRLVTWIFFSKFWGGEIKVQEMCTGMILKIVTCISISKLKSYIAILIRIFSCFFRKTKHPNTYFISQASGVFQIVPRMNSCSKKKHNIQNCQKTIEIFFNLLKTTFDERNFCNIYSCTTSRY